MVTMAATDVSLSSYITLPWDRDLHEYQSKWSELQAAASSHMKHFHLGCDFFSPMAARRLMGGGQSDALPMASLSTV
jgi:hypothetical protein